MMNAGGSPKEDISDSSRTPLYSIGLTILVVLMVPVLLYSIGPEGPIKVGDVVFVKNRHRVKFLDPTIPRTQGYKDNCILESRVQLVVQKMNPMSGDFMVAEPIGVEEIDVPYCPPRTSILLQPNQTTLRADVWKGLRDAIWN